MSRRLHLQIFMPSLQASEWCHWGFDVELVCMLIPQSPGEARYMHAPSYTSQGPSEFYGPSPDISHGGILYGHGNEPGSGNYQEYPPPNGQPGPNMHPASLEQDGFQPIPRRGREGSRSIICDDVSNVPL